MPHLVKPWIVSYVDAEGRRCKKQPGAKKVRARAGKWYGVGIPGTGKKKDGKWKWKRVPLAADKDSARRMLEDLVRASERGEAGLPDKAAAATPLAAHLEEFERDVARGLATRSRRKRPPNPAQARLVAGRARSVIDGCSFSGPEDFNASAPGLVADFLQSRLALPRKDGGLSHQSAKFHLDAIRRFVWWLSRRRVKVRADLFDGVPGFDPSSNRVHQRRRITPDELASVLDAALSDAGTWRGLSGRDRYHLYLVAFATGFRSGELAALAKSSFKLDAEPPTAFLPAKLTKGGRDATMPLPPAVAAQMRSYLADRPKGIVWPGTWSEKPAKMLRRDLKKAGVPYAVEGDRGVEYADFHALRHSFVSALAGAGVGPKELQELARHTDPRLTLGLYTHSSREQLAGAMARLPLPGATPGPLDGLSREQVEAGLIALAGLFAATLGASRSASGNG